MPLVFIKTILQVYSEAGVLCKEWKGIHMEKAKKLFGLLRNCVEIYIPIASFCMMFMIFILQIFCRYLLKQPLPWAYEVTVTCYLWMVILSACYAQREKSHVTFTLLYDVLSVKGKAVCAFLGNLIIAVAFGVSVVPSFKFIQFMDMQKTSVFKIGLNIVYAPYMLFVLIIFIYAITDLYRDFMVFSGLGGEAAEKRLLQESKAEYQEAIESALKGMED